MHAYAWNTSLISLTTQFLARKVDQFIWFHVKLYSFILELQVSQDTYNGYANGYLASCESNSLRISVDKIRSLTARVIVSVPKELFFRSSGKAEHLRRPFLSVYYKPTKTKNETHFDATQSHKWFRLVEKVSHNLASTGRIFPNCLFNIQIFPNSAIIR